MATLAPVSPGGSGPRRPRRDADDARRWGSGLRRRLLAAGPLAARLGAHLGGRVDLFTGTDCLELLAIADRAPASPAERVAELVERQLGGRPEQLFERFDPQPVESGLVLQRHRARLAGEGPVLVELVHPELVPDLEAGEPRRVAERLIAAGELPAGARDAVAELERRLDLRDCSLRLGELADEVAGASWIEVPRVHLQLSSRRVRVLSDSEGRSAAELADDADRATRKAQARRLARGWLALALGGDLVPAEPWGADVRYLASGRVAFLGGGSYRLPRGLQSELRDYLAAVAAKRPARAALAFLELLPELDTDRRLRDRLRHTDPFRDRGWDVGGDLFARQVLAHWRTASELGYCVPDGLVPFYRGLFLLNQETRRLVADATPVRDGLREARLLLLFDELRDEAESGRWSGTLERQLGLAGALPQKLDRILTLAAEDGRDEESAGRRRGPRQEPERGRGRMVTACLLALTAVALLTHHLAEAGAGGATAERLGALGVLLLGGLLLRAATRSGDG